MARILLPMSMLSLLSIGAIFGFFYAWVCSTMWGLDATDSRVAISAMQAMNASVRNAIFFPAFFLTPVFLALTALITWSQACRMSATLFAASAAVYFCGAFLITATINVPMNEALAQVTVPADAESARRIWQDYSQPWQTWNTVRTVFSGIAVLLAGMAILKLKTETR
ncbi:MAG: DUF1772 domain-containing protein [Azospirillaceae bacterium]